VILVVKNLRNVKFKNSTHSVSLLPIPLPGTKEKPTLYFALLQKPLPVVVLTSVKPAYHILYNKVKTKLHKLLLFTAECTQISINSHYSFVLLHQQILSVAKPYKETMSFLTTELSTQHDGSDIQGRSLDITQPVGSSGCLWKLRMINGMFHHCHLP